MYVLQRLNWPDYFLIVTTAEDYLTFLIYTYICRVCSYNLYYIHCSDSKTRYIIAFAGNMSGCVLRRRVHCATMECRLQVQVYGLLRSNAIYSKTDMYNRYVYKTTKCMIY